MEEKHPLFSHNWKFSALNHNQYTSGPGETLVLLTCSCGAKKTERLNGLWTAEQLGYNGVAAVREP